MIERRIATGRLYPIWRGVYAVGRADGTREGRWMAAVLTCGPKAVLSHGSAAALWGIGELERGGEIEISVPRSVVRSGAGIRIHRRAGLADRDLAERRGIPVTSLVLTFVDLAARLPGRRLEAMINQADKAGLIDPESLREGLERYSGRPGAARLRRTLDRRTFTLNDSDLERLFKPLAREAGLPLPETKQWVNGFEVDFYWPDLGLVVETDGLRYHRTPAEQARDRLRDQAHTSEGLTPLRFTHAQVKFEPEHVERTLAKVASRLLKAPRSTPQ
jgi:very-short-patch-repair endonuclease